MRKIKLLKNTFSSLFFQLTAIICGFVLPRIILNTYGSEVNGLVNSITQFLQVISFLELGVGAVVQSSLYKPLANNEKRKISEICASANKFFKTIAKILFIYIIILIIVYPYIVNQNFEFLYTALLIAAISISSFSQYYFGVVDRLLLTADQKGYIQYNAQTVTLILNTVASCVLIKFGASIQLVKLVTSLIYVARPLFLRWYVNRNYDIDRKIKYEKEPIAQKWNGVAQHVAYVVLDGTDNIVLTLFADLKSVSVYSVYNLVFSGVKQLLTATTSGVQSLLGELWAKQELAELNKTFGWFEWVIHTSVTFIFGCTGMLIVPFIQVYTDGIIDVQYTQKLFAILMVFAHAMHCLRLPYNIMILAGGHYKQTQHCYVIAAICNIVLSVIMVSKFGLIGVAIGTLAAMCYQTIWMVLYDSKNLIKWPIKYVIKQMIVDFITVILGVLFTRRFAFSTISYFSWTLLAVKVVLVWIIVIAIVNSIFYKSKLDVFIKKIQQKVKCR